MRNNLRKLPPSTNKTMKPTVPYSISHFPTAVCLEYLYKLQYSVLVLEAVAIAECFKTLPLFVSRTGRIYLTFLSFLRCGSLFRLIKSNSDYYKFIMKFRRETYVSQRRQVWYDYVFGLNIKLNRLRTSNAKRKILPITFCPLAEPYYDIVLVHSMCAQTL